MTTVDLASSSVSLRSYLQVLRRQRWLIIGVILLTVAFGTVPSMLEDARYASTARLRVTPASEEGVFDTGGEQNLASSRFRELATEVEVLKSVSIRNAVIERLAPDVPEFEAPSVEAVGLSDIIEIRVVAYDPNVAAEVANTYAEVFVAGRRERSVSVLTAKASELRTRSAETTAQFEAVNAQLANEALAPEERAALQGQQGSLLTQIQEFDRRADELEVEASLREGGTEIISPAGLALTPVSPKPMNAAVLALTLGVFLSLALAVLADTVQDRVGSTDELDEVDADATVLASVPHAGIDPMASDLAGFASREAYRYLRTSVRFVGQNSNLRSMLITSAIGGEGKSTTAANLATVMADAGDRVVLVDCDLRRPSLHDRFGLPNTVGLTSLLVGDVSLQEATHFVRENLAVLTSGPLVRNPTEMLSSRTFERVLAAIVEQADFTILDAPPVLPVADAVISGSIVDGVIVVGRIGLVRRRLVREALRRLRDSGVNLIGLVANDGPVQESYRDYRAFETGAPPHAGASPPPQVAAGSGSR